MIRKIQLAVAVVVMGAAGTAAAAPYGAAGCGLGSMVIGDSPGFMQVIAATLNGIAGNQTFGITTGTLNCGEAAAEGISAKTQIYIEGNREVVARDIARGQGDTIVGLSAIAGCGDTTKVGATLQSRYESIFPTDQTSSEQVTKAIINALRADASLACQDLS